MLPLLQNLLLSNQALQKTLQVQSTCRRVLSPRAAAEFGPQQKMSLDADLVQVLTDGDAVRLEELLMGREGHDGDDGCRRSDSLRQLQVSINVGDVALRREAAPRSRGTNYLLGKTSNGNTALHLVASRGHVELTKLISEMAPSLVATTNKCLDTPLHCAARTGRREVAAYLLPMMRTAAGGGEEETAPPLRATNQLGATALYEAVRHRRADGGSIHGGSSRAGCSSDKRRQWRRLPVVLGGDDWFGAYGRSAATPVT